MTTNEAVHSFDPVPLAGLVVLVTGAASGIGEATAQALAAASAHPVLLDRDADALSRLRAELGDVLAVEADVSSQPDVDRAVAAVLDTHGRIDGLVNNVGIGLHEAVESGAAGAVDTGVRDQRRRCAAHAAGGAPHHARGRFRPDRERQLGNDPDRPGGRRSLCRALLELGGKDGVFVAEDADLDEAARHIVWGALQNGGYGCISLEVRLRRGVRPRRLRGEAVRVGSDDDADIGPVPLSTQIPTIQHHIEDAVRNGAEVALGGADAVVDGRLPAADDPRPRTGRLPDHYRGDLRPDARRRDRPRHRRGGRDHQPGAL